MFTKKSNGVYIAVKNKEFLLQKMVWKCVPTEYGTLPILLKFCFR